MIPAIDLLDGRAVRLAEGDRSRSTIYSDEPWALAEEFARVGAKRIHVVDLDGAFAGAPRQIPLIKRLIAAVREFSDVEIEVGGGIRDAAAVEQLIDAGVDKVVIGTLAIREPELVAELCRRYPDAMVVAIDARDGMVAVEGWTESSTVPAIDLAARAASWGAAALLYTDVARDGTGEGPAVAATADIARAAPIPVIASGGIGALDHLRALAAAGIPLCVVGRALYDRRFTLAEAVRAAAA
ncbi:MAG TPA: 1-(5-phosphoribosyl)-5-[(5-phosphoribosylamino)methylideneamino]imidazole-4-carboxamide isomerase [Kofleriaceae bacterium]|nr:1-(5-phosphoribosyl)-5-[(5-phosphoribosylamino)methylideneamino]imidazole-4-carboxamide isomerase [Kofleriaceae bacterium]